jgi:anti-anti-sigma factor
MKLTLLSDTPELVRVRCSGEISQAQLPPGSDPLVELLSSTVYSRRLTVDLEPASYIDSSGISLLIVWQKRFKRDGGLMVLYNIPPLVQQVLDLLNLRAVLTLAADEQAATALARGEKP